MDPPTPVEPPPPAYDAQHDYDRKISDALQQSLQQQSSTPPDREEEWESWDEARFEAAAARAREQESSDESPRPVSHISSEKARLAMQDVHSSQGASSSTSPQSTINKRPLPSSPPPKERPSWFAEAQLDLGDSVSGRSRQTAPTAQIHFVPPEEEDPDEGLPPFAPVGPSLEGPPFDEVVRQTQRLQLGSGADSPPQSPLDSVEDSDTLPEPPSLPPPSSRSLGYGDFRQRSTPPRQPMPSHMLRTSSLSSSSPRPPPMRFDPSIAYTRPQALGASPGENTSKPSIDASAFYNSSVSSLMGPSQQPLLPKKSSHSLNRGTSAASGTYNSGGPAMYPQVPRIPPAPSHPIPSGLPHNSFYQSQGPGYMPPNQFITNQYAPYSQPQQPQQVSSMQLYGAHLQGPEAGPNPHWSSSYGGPGQ